MFALNLVSYPAVSGSAVNFQTAVEHTSWQCRMVVLALAGLVAAVDWYRPARSATWLGGV
jgi:hypothetical protein